MGVRPHMCKWCERIVNDDNHEYLSSCCLCMGTYCRYCPALVTVEGGCTSWCVKGDEGYYFSDTEEGPPKTRVKRFRPHKYDDGDVCGHEDDDLEADANEESEEEEESVEEEESEEEEGVKRAKKDTMVDCVCHPNLRKLRTKIEENEFHHCVCGRGSRRWHEICKKCLEYTDPYKVDADEVLEHVFENSEGLKWGNSQQATSSCRQAKRQRMKAEAKEKARKEEED